jgi:lysyl-tRNA synthetase class II
MHDANIVSFEYKRQRSEEVHDRLSDLIVRQHCGCWLAGFVERPLFAKEPMIIVLAGLAKRVLGTASLFREIAQKQVQIVVAEHTLGAARFHELLDQADSGRAVGPSIGQIANKDKSPPLRVRTIRTISKARQQILQRINLTVDVTHHIDWASEEILDERAGSGRHVPLFGLPQSTTQVGQVWSRITMA